MRTPGSRPSRRACSPGPGRACLRAAAAALLTVGVALVALCAFPPAALGGPEPAAGDADGAGARSREVARQLHQQEAQLLAARGRKLLASGAYAEAAQALREAVRLDPDDAAARKLLATAETALGIPKSDAVLNQARERQSFKAQALLRQLQLDLFEAECALRTKDYERAAQRAERALAGVGYIEDAGKAAETRERAAKLLAEARAAREAAAAVARQADFDRAVTQSAAQKSRQAREQAEGLRALRDQAWKHIDAREYGQALAIADQMLKADPDGRDALIIRDRARQALLTAGTLRGKSPERRKAEDGLLASVEEEFKPLKPGVILARDPNRRQAKVQERPMEAWEQELRAKLARPVAVEFRETPLAQAVEQLATVGGVNVVLDPEVGAQAATITIPGTRMPLESLLRWVARFGGLHYCLRDGAVLLTSRNRAFDTAVTRLYDVSTLLVPPSGGEVVATPGAMEPGPRPTQAADAENPDPEPVGRGWVEFIRSTIAAETWERAGMGGVLQERQPFTIQYRNGRIVVVHVPEVQQEIEDLLNNFRKARNLQVHILARFITIDREFLDSLDLSFLYDSRLKSTTTASSARMAPATEVPSMPRFDDWGSPPFGGLSVRYSRLDDDSLTALFRAVMAGQKGSLLQAPRLTCFNTQRANIQVVTNRNYVRRVSSDFVPEIGNIPSGVIFDVQPFVSADRRYITLVLQPQSRSLVSMTDFVYGHQTVQLTQDLVAIVPIRIQLPTTELRSVGTTITVPNGGTLLMGGFTEVEEHFGVSTLPLVDSIPLLRYILRGWTRLEGRRSLIMLVTAQTIEDIFEEE